MEALINTFQKTTGTVNTDLADLHFHNGYEFLFVTGGWVEVELNGAAYSITAPAMLLLNPFEQHKIIGAAEEYERTVLVLNAEVLEQTLPLGLTAMLKCRPEGFSPVLSPCGEDFRRICGLLQDLETEEKTPGLFGEQFLTNSVYNLLILLCRIRKGYPDFSPRMMEIQAYMDEQYAQIETVGEVARHFCLSPAHFSRSFKVYSGYAPVEYLIHTRLYHARQLLICSEMTVSEISDETGFREVNHFIRTFKKKFGVSPRQFRKDYKSRLCPAEACR